MKFQAEWVTSWNQSCRGKYQQPQICRWYYSNGRRRRGTKEILDGGEGEWKSWLKIQHSKNEDHGIWSHHFMASRRGKTEKVTDFLFLGSKVTADDDYSLAIRRHLLLWKESYDKPRQHTKKQRHHFADKNLYNQSYSFSSSHVQMWELDHKKDWVLKNWCFQIVVLEKTLWESLGQQRDQTSQS